jgi:hypothetical protein
MKNKKYTPLNPLFLEGRARNAPLSPFFLEGKVRIPPSKVIAIQNYF